jgi:MarR family transcriptional regulator, transcriptional regulator for hemolysin
MQPAQLPIGLQLSQAARAIGRAFDEALAGAGGSLPVWLVLLSMKTRQITSQRELAAAVGIREATLTHHLNGMENAGLITRRRDPANRRIHIVELTPDGEAVFLRLADTAMSFDGRLRDGLSDQDLAGLRDVLTRLAANVGASPANGPPWAGLADHR